MTMIGSMLRFGRRQFHTIISTEMIKPSSPTPSYLKTYNLTLLDQTIGINNFIPVVAFYPNTGIYHNSHDKTLDLKNSLSKILTKYYPFAGRHAKIAPSHVDCNDDGAEFHVASIDCTLSDFLKNSQHEDLHQFFPYSQIWYKSNRKSQGDQVIPLSVQVNHFECGGVAVGVSLSHKIADGSSFLHFFHDWAKMTRFCSREQKHAELPTDPHFISFPNKNINFDGFSREGYDDCVTRSFIFPNSKINDLKLKVKAMTAESGQPITNPTRFEVLNWLLYKCAVEAATKNNLGNFKPTACLPTINIRGIMREPLPKKTIGNYVMVMKIPTKNENEMKPESFISEIRKQKIQLRSIKNIEAALDLIPTSENALEAHQKDIDDSYFCSNVYGNPTYEIDFGWGKPVKVTFAGNVRNFFLLMDAPNRDGIEALVCLEKKDMPIIQRDPELLAFC